MRNQMSTTIIAQCLLVLVWSGALANWDAPGARWDGPRTGLNLTPHMHQQPRSIPFNRKNHADGSSRSVASSTAATATAVAIRAARDGRAEPAALPGGDGGGAGGGDWMVTNCSGVLL